jgi:hypothetical protein
LAGLEKTCSISEVMEVKKTPLSLSQYVLMGVISKQPSYLKGKRTT